MNNTNCLDTRLLSEFVSGRLSETASTQIRKHLQQCELCMATVSSLSSETMIEPSDVQRPPSEGSEFASEVRQPVAVGGLSDLLAELKKIPGRVQREQGIDLLPAFHGQVAVGTQLRNYVLEEKIAESGMGVVYRARHSKLGKQVALKVMRPHAMKDPVAVERFHQEVAASGRLEHPNIVLARDADEVDGIHFLVMELVDGVDLHNLVKQQGPLAVADACEIMRQAAVALQHVADNGMVHRDIKPSNLMLTKSGVVKLLDLGLAKLRAESESDDSNSITSTGQIMGTVDYMSPEQATDSRTADIRADIYSLGCTLYYLLTAEAPFRRQGRMKTLMAHASDEPPRLPDPVPEELNAFYLRMLNKQAGQRPVPPHVIAARMADFTTAADLAAVASIVPRETQATVETTTTVAAESFSVVPTQAASQKTEIQMRREPSGRGRRISRRLLGLAALPLAILLGVIIYIETDKGSIRIDVADDIKELVTINVLRDGKELVEGWQVQGDGNTQSVRTGRVEVKIVGDGSDELTFSFRNDEAEVKRGNEIVVFISRKIKRSPVVSGIAKNVDLSKDDSHVAEMNQGDAKQKNPTSGPVSNVPQEVETARWTAGKPRPYDCTFGMVAAAAPLQSKETWQVISQAPQYLLDGMGTLLDVTFTSDGARLAIRDYMAGGVKFYKWDGSNYSIANQVSAGGDYSECVAFSPDASEVFLTEILQHGDTETNRVMRIRSTKDFQVLKQVEFSDHLLPGVPLAPLDSPVWHSDGTQVAFIAAGDVWLWKPNAEKPISIFRTKIENWSAEFRGKLALDWRPKSSTLVLRYPDGSFAEIDTLSGEFVDQKTNGRTVENRMAKITFNAAGTKLLTPVLLDGASFERDERLKKMPSAAAWSPDSGQIAFLFPDNGGTVEIRDAESLETRKKIVVGHLPLTEDKDHVNAQIHWPAQDKPVVIVCEGQLIQLNLKAEQVAQRSGTEQTVHSSMERTNNGRFWTASFRDGTTRIFDSRGIQQAALRTNPPGTNIYVRLNDDGSRIAIYRRELSKLEIWDVRQRKLIRTFTIPNVANFTWATNSELLISHRDGNFMERYNVDTGESSSVTDDRFHGFLAHRFSSTGNLAVGWNQKNELVCFALDSDEVQWTVAPPSKPLRSPVWLPDSTAVALLCEGHLILVDADTGKLRWEIEVTNSRVVAVDATDDNVLLAEENYLRRYSVSSGKNIQIQSTSRHDIGPSFSKSPDRNLLIADDTVVVAAMHYPIRGFSSVTGDVKWSIIPLTGAYDSEPYTATFSAAGEWLNPDPEMEKHLAWMKWDGDVATAVPRAEIEAELDEIEAKRVAEVARRAEQQKQVAARPAWPKGAPWKKGESRIPGMVEFPAPLPDGRRWNMLREAPNWFILCVRWSPDGRYLATASSHENFLRLYEWKDQRLVLVNVLNNTASQFTGDYGWCEFSPDGKHLAAGNYVGKGHVAVWNAETWEFETELTSPEFAHLSVADGCWSSGSDALYLAAGHIYRVSLTGQVSKVTDAARDQGGEYRQVQVAEEKQRIFGLQRNGTIIVTDFEGSELASVEAHGGERELQLSPDEQFLFLEGFPNSPSHKVWSVTDSGTLMPIKSGEWGGTQNVGGWSSDSKHVVFGNSGRGFQGLVVDDVTDDAPYPPMFCGFPKRFDNPHGFRSLSWNAAKPIIAVTFDGTLFTVNAETGAHTKHWLGAPAQGLAVRDSGSGISITYDDGHSFRAGFDGQSVESPRCADLPRNWTLDSLHGEIIVRSHNDQTGQWIEVRDVATDRQIYGWNAEASQMQCEGRWLSYVATQRPKDQPIVQIFHAWDPVLEDEWQLPLTANFRRYSWSSDTQQMAMITDDNRLRIYRTGSPEPTGDVEITVPGQERLAGDAVRSLVWNDDGRRILIQTSKEILLVDSINATVQWRILAPKAQETESGSRMMDIFAAAITPICTFIPPKTVDHCRSKPSRWTMKWIGEPSIALMNKNWASALLLSEHSHQCLI